MKHVALLGLLLALSTQAFAQHEEAKAGGEHAGQQHQRKFDLNGDGNISRDEAMQRAGARFDKADTNRDGVLSKEERMAARQSMQEHRAMRKEHRAPDNNL